MEQLNARENKIPFMGICLGMQCALIEYARNVLKLSEANSVEFEPNTPHPIFQQLEILKNINGKREMIRLGSHSCI